MSGGSHFVAMTTPMSLQPWWWQIFILIQLWSQFFQMFVYGDVCLSSHLHIPGGSTLLPYGPHSFTILSEKFGQLARFFWANGLPPPLAKNFPYAYAGYTLSCDLNFFTSCIILRPLGISFLCFAMLRYWKGKKPFIDKSAAQFCSSLYCKFYCSNKVE